MAKSKDVTGHPGEDGKLLKPLAGKTDEQIYRAHHGLDETTGKLLPGTNAVHEGKGCECDHCSAYVAKKEK